MPRDYAMLSCGLGRTSHVPYQTLGQFRYGATEEFNDSIRGRIHEQFQKIVVSQEHLFPEAS